MMPLPLNTNPMKVYSILFSSSGVGTPQFGLFTIADYDVESAMNKGIEKLNKEHGDIGWKLNSLNIIDLPSFVSVVAKDDPNKLNGNWAMKLIVDNKDLRLFESVKPYLKDFEVKYLEEKIK